METTHIHVLSIGHLLMWPTADIGHYQVHSCFAHALNLVWGNGLCTLLDESAQNLPTAIRLALPTTWDWREHATQGQCVVCRNGVLHGRGWQAELTAAPRWQPAMQRANPQTLAQVLLVYDAIANQLHQYGEQHAIRSHVQLLPDWPTGGREVHLSFNTAAPELEQQVLQLLGFGGGLTPDGDDYLLGYLAALQIWQSYPHIAAHMDLLSRIIEQHLARTTDISRHYLALAVQGHYGEALNHLQGVLVRQCALPDILAAAMQVMTFGAASGVDVLAGFLHGIRALQTGLNSEYFKSVQ